VLFVVASDTLVLDQVAVLFVFWVYAHIPVHFYVLDGALFAPEADLFDHEALGRGIFAGGGPAHVPEEVRTHREDLRFLVYETLSARDCHMLRVVERGLDELFMLVAT